MNLPNFIPIIHASVGLFMSVSGVFLGETNAIRGIRGGCQLLGNMSGQQAHESFACPGNTKALLCPAVAHWKTFWPFCKNTQPYMCAQAFTHTYYRTSFSLSHTHTDKTLWLAPSKIVRSFPQCSNKKHRHTCIPVYYAWEDLHWLHSMCFTMLTLT